jgi:stearoyl-CoA desaturase (delta-9 desaturase)
VLAIAIFFVVHWQGSVFFQSFFLHRYGAHKQFTMSKGWERFFHLASYIFMGSSYLSPRAYAYLHRMHHAYSDTEKDPHSPVIHPNIFKMMWRTNVMYQGFRENKVEPEARFKGDEPHWPLIDEKLSCWPVSIAWGTLYALFYLVFAPSPWFLLLAPVHWLMGPIHGSIVNYFGHKLGYRNFESTDNSKNTLVFDVLTMGELFQNNHHKYAMSPNFGAKWYEIDPAYRIMQVFHWLKIIDMSKSQVIKPNRRPVLRPIDHVPPPRQLEAAPMDAE